MNTAPSSHQTHLAVTAVSKQFGATQAVEESSFTVERGQTLALLGPSGCGKTTLLRMIAGLEQPDAGSIVIDGEPVFGDGVDVAPRLRNVGLVFQDGALFPHMTVLDNVAYGLGKRPDITRARKALALVDLEGYEHRLPGSLSGGQQQRVAVARALAPTPRGSMSTARRSRPSGCGCARAAATTVCP